MNTSDFPQIQQKMSDKALILPISEFIQSLHQVLFSVSKDESRPFLTGVLFIFGEDSLVLVASDGFRLSQKKIAIPKNAFTGRLILPKSALNELTHLDTNDKLLFEMKKADNQAIFSFQDTIMGSRIIEGDFPNFEKIIPKAARVKVSLEKEDLASALKIASVIARDSANVVTFIANDEGVTINAKNPQTGMQTNSIPAQVTGGDVEILFNVRFLEEFLSIVKGKDVEIELNDSVSPGIFKDPTDASYLHLIMPIKQ
jgi:DNA polymerase-3 subunit beta